MAAILSHIHLLKGTNVDVSQLDYLFTKWH